MDTGLKAPETPLDDSLLLNRGRLMVLLAGCFWSLGGMFFRLVEQADVWQVLFYRSLAAGTMIAGYIWLRSAGGVRETYRRAGFNALIGGFWLSITFTCWLFALAHTSVANALFLLSIQPFLAALLGWIVLSEKMRKATWAAMAVALGGVAVMVSDGLAQGAVLGDLFALGSALGFALFTVTIRRGKESDQAPAIVYGAIFTAVAAAVMCQIKGTGLWLTPNDLTFSLLQGFAQIGIGFIFFSLGARYVTAGEVALLAQMEVVLGPLWVWLAVREVPEFNTLIGGAVVIAAVLGNILSGMRRRRPPIGLAS